jgi:hypothetical protein
MRLNHHTDVSAEGSERRPGTSLSRVVAPTPEARIYAVKELARRAGVSRDFFRNWRIEVRQDHTLVSLGPDSNGKVYFPHTTELQLQQFASNGIPVGRAAWFCPPEDTRTPPDLFVPFCDLSSDAFQPLYTQVGEKTVACRADLLVSFLFTLSRLEETLSAVRDEHSRFPASASIASRYSFLNRPILDEHGRAFQQVLFFLIPAWQPEKRALRLKLTHDIDDVGIPFQVRASLGHALKRKRPSAASRDVLALLSSVLPAELAQVETLADISKAHGMRSAFYWKVSSRGPRDSGYDPSSGKIKRVIDRLKQDGFELGVHPGYDTFQDRSKLAAEVAALRKTLNRNQMGGRQHYLRWSPETWLDWEACGLSYDSSLGFAEQFGFRAGTAYPFRPWSLSENRELHLVELPLLLMDCTPVKYMSLNLAEGLSQIRTLIERTAFTGGVFTLLWHNTPFLDPDYDGWYEAILGLLSGVPSCEVPANSEELW